MPTQKTAVIWLRSFAVLNFFLMRGSPTSRVSVWGHGSVLVALRVLAHLARAVLCVIVSLAAGFSIMEVSLLAAAVVFVDMPLPAVDPLPACPCGIICLGPGASYSVIPICAGAWYNYTTRVVRSGGRCAVCRKFFIGRSGGRSAMLLFLSRHLSWWFACCRWR